MKLKLKKFRDYRNKNKNKKQELISQNLKLSATLRNKLMKKVYKIVDSF